MQVGSLLPKQCHVQHQKLLAETHIYPTLNMRNVFRVKCISNGHIDVVVCEGAGAQPWRATGFYGHPDAGMNTLLGNYLNCLNSSVICRG